MIKKRIGIMLTVVMLISVFGLAGCTNEDAFARQRIKEITEVEIPDDSKILYHHIDNTFVNGRRDQHTVFEFENEPTDWLTENAFSDVRDAKNENYFSDDWGFMTIKTEEVPNEYIPDFENTYFWLRTKRVYFFYFPDKFMLIVYVAGS